MPPPDTFRAPATRQASAAAAAAACQQQEEAAAVAAGANHEGQPHQHDGYHSLSHAYETYLAHDKHEQNHWQDVCRSYRQYATFAMAQWANHHYRLYQMPAAQQKLLPPALVPQTPEYQQRARAYKEAAIRNQFTLDCILRHAGQEHSQECTTTTTHSSDAQMSKVGG